MAGDWIKMRTNLRRSPKVVRIASALKADRLRVIGGLHAVWCLFDEHSIDGHLDGYTLETLDEEIGWPGFGAAMVAAEWLEDGGDFLSTPRFDEHNGQSAKRRCQDAERKRNERKTSASKADKSVTREEKRREEKEENHKTIGDGAPAVVVERRQANLDAIEEQLGAEVAAEQGIQGGAAPAEPEGDKPPRFEGKRALMAEGVGDQLAADFIKLRTAKRAPLSQSALDGLKREAAKAGLSVADAVLICCERGWQSIKADWLAPRSNATVANRTNGRPSINSFGTGADDADDPFNNFRRAG